MTKFSSTVVDERFRAKIGFDTNLLMYLLDCNYPKLNEFVSELGNYKVFVDLVTNSYAIFELYENGKKTHFIRIAKNFGYSEHRLTPDIFNINDRVRFEGLLKLFSLKRLLSERNYKRLRSFWLRHVIRNTSIGGLFFFNKHEEIMNAAKLDILRVSEFFSIEVVGKMHDNLWGPTNELIFHSRISREDSLIAMSFLKPSLERNQENITLLTNDGDFESFYSEAGRMGLLHPLLDRLAIPSPSIERITKIKGSYGSTSLFNLRSAIPLRIAISDLVKGFVKRQIVQNRMRDFIGTTDGSVLKKNPKAICIKLNGKGEYLPTKKLVFIGGDLDYFYILPFSISEFSNHKKNLVTFPVKYDENKNAVGNKVVFFFNGLEENDPDKPFENELLLALKKSDNLVFVHPDS